MQPWVLRLAPGNGLVEALDDARKAQGWTAVFAEILLTELTDVVFRRRPDVRTGYRELVIEPRHASR